MIRIGLSHKKDRYEIQLLPNKKNPLACFIVLLVASAERIEKKETVMMPVDNYVPEEVPILLKNGKNKMIEIPKVDKDGNEIEGATVKVQAVKIVHRKKIEKQETEVITEVDVIKMKQVEKWEMFCKPNRRFVKVFGQNYLRSKSIANGKAKEKKASKKTA